MASLRRTDRTPPPAIVTIREAPSRPGELQPTCKDEYSSDYYCFSEGSGAESDRHRHTYNVAAKQSHSSGLGDRTPRLISQKRIFPISVSCKRNEERSGERSEDCTNPNCTKCGLQADGTPGRCQSSMGARDWVHIERPQSMRPESASRPSNYHAQPPPANWVPTTPLHIQPPYVQSQSPYPHQYTSPLHMQPLYAQPQSPYPRQYTTPLHIQPPYVQPQSPYPHQYTTPLHMQPAYVQSQSPYPHQYTSPPQDNGLPPSMSAYAVHPYYSHHSTRYPGPNVRPPGHITPGTSLQQNSHMPAKRYPPILRDLNRAWDSKSPSSLSSSLSTSSSSDDEEDKSRGHVQEDYAPMPPPPRASRRSSRRSSRSRPSTTQSDGYIRKLEDLAKEQERLYSNARAERKSEQEAQGQHACEHAERRIRLEQETKERTPTSSERRVKADTSLRDTLDAKMESQSPKRALVSVESPHSPTSSSKIREDMSKDLELKIYPHMRPKFPMLLRKMDSSLVDDRPMDDHSLQADIYHCDISTRLDAEALLSQSFPVKSTLSARFLNSQIPGLERDNRDHGANHPAKLVKRPNDAKKLANDSRPNSIGQTESPSFKLSTSAQTTESDTRDSGHIVHEAMEGPAKELVLLSKASKSDMPETSVAVNFSPISCLESSDDSSTGETEEEEDHSFVEAARESDEASEECEVNVKSALDIAMNVVKNLLLQELLDYALPNAIDALEGSSSSRSGGSGSSASSNLSSSTSNSQTSQRRKRSRGNGCDPGDSDGGGDDSDGDNRPKKKSEKSPADRLPQRRLKCPFHQRQPEKYKKAACKGDGFVDMAKLKDHIKRVHTQPLRCSRCWLEMKSEEAYSEHLQQEDICNKKAEQQEDRIRPQLLNRLDFKKAPYANARNVEEKWKMLFSVLFPNDTNIPSPYEQQGISPQLERALSEALDEELTRELAPIIEPIMTRIKGCIPAIIESCRQKLMSTSPFSDDEAVFTPSATSSGIGGSDSKPGSSMNEAIHRASPAASRCSRSSFGVVPIAEVLSNDAQGNQQQHLVDSTSNVNMNGRLEVSSPGSSTDYSLFYYDTAVPTHPILG